MSALLARSQLRFAIRNPVGTAASLIGVTLAVMAVVAVHLVSQSIRGALEAAGVPGGAAWGHTHVVTRTALTEADYFGLRRQWRRGELAEVTAMVPVIDGFVTVGGESYRLLGLDPLAAWGSRLNQPLTAAPASDGWRRFLTGDVLIAAPAIRRAIEAADGQVAGTAVTLIEAETTAAGVILADLPTAQRLLDREGELDGVWIRVAGARNRILDWLDALLPGIAAAAPAAADPVIAGFRVTAIERWNPAARFADSIVFNLGALAGLSLLMAAFLATQASYSNAARRRRERERLIAIGVSRSRLRWLAVAEGGLVGCAGVALGLALGVGVARLLAASPGLPELDGWVIAKALVCGVLVSSLGPLFADHRARDQRRRLGFGIGLVAVVAAAFGLADGSLLGVFAALLAVGIAQIAGIVPLVGVGTGVLASLTSKQALSARSSLRAAAARSGEIGLALGALSVAAAVAIGMDLMVESLRRDFTDMLDQRLWHGVYVSAGDDELAFDVDWIRGLPGVNSVRRYGDLDARLNRGLAEVSLADLDAAETARYEFAGPLPGRALLNEAGGRFLGLGVGDMVTVTAAGTSVEVEIGHIFRDFGAAGPRLVLPRALGSRFPTGVIHWRRLAVLADPAAVPGLTATLGARYGAARVRDQSDIRAVATVIFDRTFVVSQALTGVAMAVAAIGLYAALVALQASRGEEFRLLSAIGYSRPRIWRLAMAQTLILGAIAALAAGPLGVGVAWILCDFVNPRAFGWSIDLHLGARSIALPMLLSIGVAAVAGALPAYRASFRGRP